MSIIPNDQIKLSAVWCVPPAENDRAHGFGGQHVGTTRVLRIEHEPTGTVIYIADGQSQHRQREVAVDALEFILTHPAFRLRP